MKYRNQQSGFTIVELLIATTVFAVILLLATVGIMTINNSFYKGITVSNTQNVARSVMDDVTQNIQFGGGPINAPSTPYPNTYAICIGSIRYSVQRGYKLTNSNPNNHVLVKDNNSSCSPGTVVSNFTGGGALPSGAVELLSANMRIVTLTIKEVGTTELYTVNVRVVYGDDDLLCSVSAGDCGSSNVTASFTAPDLRCKPQTGTQFCAVSDITTTVEKRVN